VPAWKAIVITVVIALVQAQAAARIASIQVKGNRRYTALEVARLSGLEIGKPATVNDLTAAANRLAGTGLFNSVKYSYTTGPGQMTVTFDVEEAPWTVPVTFDNFVWLSDAEVQAALREKVPSFDGTAPINAGAAEFIAAALQEVLGARHIPGQVTFSAQAELRTGAAQSTSPPRYIFIVKDPTPKVCAIHAAAAAAIPEKELLTPLAGALGGDYSRVFIAAAANGTLTDMYRRKGHWRAAFAPPTTVLNECDGVAVNLNVTEGVPYTWDRAEWVGNAALAADVLTKTLAMKSGEVADVSRIQSSLRDVNRAYGHVGYLEAHVDYAPRLDDQARRAVFAFQVHEGPQYHMGTLSFPNLRESDAAALLKKWQLKPGDVFDTTYESEFAAQELFPLRASNNTRARLEREIDRPAHIVNLRVVFK
jgi:outer membrane protein insertion porin family